MEAKPTDSAEPSKSPHNTPISSTRSSSPSASDRSLPLLGVISLLVALCAVVLLSVMDSNHLSHSRSAYYLSTLSAQPPPRKIRIGSFNIRYSPGGPFKPLRSLLGKVTRQKDEHKKWGEAKWEERREKLVDQVLFHELDCIGFQEVLDHQYKDLEVLLGEEFEHVGVGRNDGKKAGEAVPIFYRKSRFSLNSVRHFWLSPTPEVPGSKGWDAGQPRMVTIARLVDLQSASRGGGGELEEIIVANTHWDDRGLEARTESAKLILKVLDDEAKNVTREENGKEPLVVLLGDLNSPAEEAGYQALTGGRYLEQKLSGDGKTFWDSRHEVATRKTSLAGPGALSRPYGPLNTFTGFVPSDEPKVIDFILVRDNFAFAPPNHDFPTLPVEEAVDTTFLDADDPDEVLASIPEPSAVAESSREKEGIASSTSTESLLSSSTTRQTRWKVSRYGVVPNFYEDVGGKRGSEEDGLIVSDHRLVVVGLEEVVA
ncbi:hypothetical protein JCM3765_005787 [Sporobolomyces pararoseus]